MLSELQQKKIEHLFNVLDANKNGELQLDDFVNVAEEIIQQLGLEKSSRPAKLILIKANRLFVQFLIDTNQPDMHIGIWDWMKFFEKEFKRPGKAGLLHHFVHRTTYHLFSLFDLNRDKHISLEEYANMWSVYKIPQDQCEASFKQLDTNKDELISADEMVAGLDNFFNSTKLDAPGNLVFGDWK